ncbi:hypothetical protein AB0P36_12945 [Streptomyces flavidovirens]|uniref:hypothetical protein n=1 Tax=Streptomyces flavidovirens TaxID=67298 RepID=UPI003430F3CA
MEGKNMLDKDAYARDLGYLELYGQEDWVGFGVVSGVVSGLLGGGVGVEQQREVALKVVGDLHDRGVVPGDLTEAPDHPFVPWELNKEDAVSRIARAMEKMAELPDTGDICWFSSD